jgi:hypothetical protein
VHQIEWRRRDAREKKPNGKVINAIFTFFVQTRQSLPCQTRRVFLFKYRVLPRDLQISLQISLKQRQKTLPRRSTREQVNSKLLVQIDSFFVSNHFHDDFFVIFFYDMILRVLGLSLVWLFISFWVAMKLQDANVSMTTLTFFFSFFFCEFKSVFSFGQVTRTQVVTQ